MIIQETVNRTTVIRRRFCHQAEKRMFILCSHDCQTKFSSRGYFKRQFARLCPESANSQSVRSREHVSSRIENRPLINKVNE